MYTHILEAALHERPQAETAMTASEALAKLLDSRQHLDAVAPEQGMDWSSNALANQVAYDIALIDLARCFGLACDPSSFEQPRRRRIELERELISRGIRLEQLDQSAHSTYEHH
jgi:hypothetical protein